MFKYDVTYKDFNGQERNESLYFHLSSPEVMDLQFNPEVDGDLDEFIKNGVRNGEGRNVWITFKLLIVNSYGRRSEDGAYFRKKPEWTEEFINSPAFEKFFEWLLLDSPDGKHAKEFYLGIMPERLKDKVDEQVLNDGGVKKKLNELSRAELEKLYLERLQSNNNNVVEGTSSERS